MSSRRELLAGALAAAIATTMTSGASAASADKTLKRIRERVGGRLGVHALDSQSGKRWGIDENSRYAMASTFKLPLAAALLWQVDRKAFTLDHTLGHREQGPASQLARGRSETRRRRGLR